MEDKGIQMEDKRNTKGIQTNTRGIPKEHKKTKGITNKTSGM